MRQVIHHLTAHTMIVTNYPVRKSGTVFKDGKLYLFRKGSGDGGVIEIIRPDTKNPSAWIKNIAVHEQFRAWRPEIDLSSIDFSYAEDETSREPVHVMKPLIDVLKVFDIQDSNKKDEALKTWGTSRRKPESFWHRNWRLAFSPIPADIRNLASQFWKKVQWNVLVSCLRVPALQEMDNLGLLVLHSHIHLVRKPRLTKPMRTLRSLVVKSRKEQVGYYGLPARNQVVKIFGKIPRESLHGWTVLTLSNILRKEDQRMVRMLSHLPSVNMAVTQIANDQSLLNAVSYKFLEEVSLTLQKAGNCRYEMDNLRDTLNMAEQLGAPSFRINSREDLWALHNELIDEINRVKRLNIILPMPPREGVEDLIRPLTTSGEIYDYGKRQGNCIASYIPRVSSGEIYLYAYQFEYDDLHEEGTFALVRRSDRWQFREVSARFNKRPSKEALHLLKMWYKGKKIDPSIHHEINSSIAASMDISIENRGRSLIDDQIEQDEIEEVLCQLSLPF